MGPVHQLDGFQQWSYYCIKLLPMPLKMRLGSIVSSKRFLMVVTAVSFTLFAYWCAKMFWASLLYQFHSTLQFRYIKYKYSMFKSLDFLCGQWIAQSLLTFLNELISVVDTKFFQYLPKPCSELKIQNNSFICFTCRIQECSAKHVHIQ